MGLFRRRPVDPLAHVDPATVPPRFAGAVHEALAARRRFLDVVAGLRAGPVRDRMVELGQHVDAGVLAVWETVHRVAEVERVAAGLEPEQVTAEHKRAQRERGVDPALAAALRERFVSVQRILNAVDDAEARLRLLDARIDAAVARAAEVAVVASDDDTAALGSELDAVVTELGALRESLDELSGR